MLTFQTYSLLAIFFTVNGVAYGAAQRSLADSKQHSHMASYHTLSCLGGLISMIYGVLGFFELKLGSAIHAYIPIACLCWAGSAFGSSLRPVDKVMATFALSFPIVAMLIFHIALP